MEFRSWWVARLPADGRRCYTTEINTLYCDAIVERWEQFTGQEAKRIAVAEEAAHAEGW